MPRPRYIVVPRWIAGEVTPARRRGRGFGDFSSLVAPLATLFVTSPFGSRSAPLAGGSTQHNGIDYAAPIGTPVYSASSGTVTYAGVQQGYGNTVMVDGGGGVVTLYGHLSQILVSVGQSVSAGDQVALSGDTGNVTGPHLHFEVRVNGVPVDPTSMLGAGAPVIPGASDAGVLDNSGDAAGLPGGLDPTTTAVIAGLTVLAVGILLD